MGPRGPQAGRAPQGLFWGRPAAGSMAGGKEGGGRERFGFAEWSNGEFRDWFVAIASEGRRNNTYKFAMARFLLDLCCDPCMVLRLYGRPRDKGAPGAVDTAGGIRVRYAEIARYFFAYYWPLACNAGLRQGPATETPLVMTAIEKEFGEGEYGQSVCQVIRDEPERTGRCIKEIARVMPRQVVYRFQKVGGRELRMFYQYAAGPADKEGSRRVDLRGGILVNRAASRFLRENYGALSRAVALEWLRATDSLNPGSPNLAGRFLAAYDGCESVCGFLPGLEIEGRHCFYCDARPRPDERMCIDHFLPADYVGGARAWNLVLACQGCGREKVRMLPPPEYVDALARRNAERRKSEGPVVPLGRMGGLERGLARHYAIAKSRGYPVAASLPVARS